MSASGVALKFARLRAQHDDASWRTVLPELRAGAELLPVPHSIHYRSTARDGTPGAALLSAGRVGALLRTGVLGVDGEGRIALRFDPDTRCVDQSVNRITADIDTRTMPRNG